MIRIALTAAAACLVAAVQVFAPAVLAQTSAGAGFPTKRITLVVPFTPGGAGDLMARVIASRMTELGGQPVVVENRAGAGGNTGSSFVAKAAPDGYTIVIGSTSSHAINSSIYSSMPYDVTRDFAPVVLVASSPHILLVHPSIPAENVAQLVQYAKDNPGKLNFSSGGNGTSTHLAGELLRTQAGIDIVHVPYKGAAEGVQGILGGQTQIMFENPSGALPQVKAGKLRGLAVTSATRSSLVEGMPTVAEAIPGFETGVWFAIYAPTKTPPEIVSRLNELINTILRMPEVRDQFNHMGMNIRGGSSAELGAYTSAEIEKWARTVKASGAKM